jgi:hypothetical protein
MKLGRFKKIIISIVVILGLLFISFPFYYAFSPDITNYFSRVEFDQEKWKDWQETETTACLRWDMTHDLIKRHKLIGLTSNEIIALLGEPDSKNKIELRYYLGMSRHGIDTGSLILTIENDKVIDCEIWHG